MRSSNAMPSLFCGATWVRTASSVRRHNSRSPSAHSCPTSGGRGESRRVLYTPPLVTLTGAVGCGKTRLACRSPRSDRTATPMARVDLSTLADDHTRRRRRRLSCCAVRLLSSSRKRPGSAHQQLLRFRTRARLSPEPGSLEWSRFSGRPVGSPGTDDFTIPISTAAPAFSAARTSASSSKTPLLRRRRPRPRRSHRTPGHGPSIGRR